MSSMSAAHRNYRHCYDHGQVREYEIHKKLQHPRVVQLLDLFEIDDNSFGTVQELCDGGDLDWHLKQHQVPAGPFQSTGG